MSIRRSTLQTDGKNHTRQDRKASAFAITVKNELFGTKLRHNVASPSTRCLESWPRVAFKVCLYGCPDFPAMCV